MKFESFEQDLSEEEPRVPGSNMVPGSVRRFVQGAALGLGLLSGEALGKEAESQTSQKIERVESKDKSDNQRMEELIEKVPSGSFQLPEHLKIELRGKDIKIVIEKTALEKGAVIVSRFRDAGMNVEYKIGSRDKRQSALNYHRDDFRAARAIQGIVVDVLDRIDIDSNEMGGPLELIIK